MNGYQQGGYSRPAGTNASPRPSIFNQIYRKAEALLTDASGLLGFNLGAAFNSWFASRRRPGTPAGTAIGSPEVLPASVDMFERHSRKIRERCAAGRLLDCV